MSARARELGGTLTVEAEPTRGTTLTLRAPFVRSRARAARAPPDDTYKGAW